MTNVIPLHTSTTIPIKSDDIYKLKITVEDKDFNYNLEYPKDKYIIISPTYNKGEIGIGILKQDKKFITQ